MTWFAVLWLNSWFRIGFYFFVAWLVHRLAHVIAYRWVGGNGRFRFKHTLRPERLNTLRGLIANAISILSFIVALLLTLALFVPIDTILWMVGLFSAAFGLGARPIISDFLTGMSFIFENTFDIDEKIELAITGILVEGVVEEVNLRTTLLRATTGEIFTVPNGEIRVVRNFSRGKFSRLKVHLKLAPTDIAKALTVLESLHKDALHQLPNLLEPWQIISEDGTLAQQTEITLVAKAKYGHAANMKPRLLAFVQEALEKEQINLTG